MKAALLYGYDQDMNVDLEIEDVPAPAITAPDEVIVRVGATGFCRTDLHIIEGVWREAMDPAARLYGIDIAQRREQLSRDALGVQLNSAG